VILVESRTNLLARKWEYYQYQDVYAKETYHPVNKSGSIRIDSNGFIVL
jgi:hypothetical protein